MCVCACFSCRMYSELVNLITHSYIIGTHRLAESVTAGLGLNTTIHIPVYFIYDLHNQKIHSTTINGCLYRLTEVK